MIRAGIAFLIFGVLGALLTTFIYTDFSNAEYVQAASFLSGVAGITMIERSRRKNSDKQ